MCFRDVNPRQPTPAVFCTDSSVRLLKFFIVCTSLVSYVAFVLSLFVPHLAFVWCLGRAVLHDSAISWISPLVFFSWNLRWVQLPEGTFSHVAAPFVDTLEYDSAYVTLDRMLKGEGC